MFAASRTVRRRTNLGRRPTLDERCSASGGLATLKGYWYNTRTNFKHILTLDTRATEEAWRKGSLSTCYTFPPDAEPLPSVPQAQLHRLQDPSVAVDVLRAGTLHNCQLDLEGALLLLPVLQQV